MKQYLVVDIVKSKNAEYIKGPQYLLDRKSIMILVNFLISVQKWNYRFLHETNAVIENRVLTENMKIFDPILIDGDYHYSIEIGDIKDCFASGIPSLASGYKQLCLSCKADHQGEFLCRNFLYRELNDIYKEKFKQALNEGDPVLLNKKDVAEILMNKSLNYHYELDFNKYSYFLELVDPWNFIVESDEGWFKYG